MKNSLMFAFIASFLVVPMLTSSTYGQSALEERIKAELAKEENKIPGKAILLIYSNTDWSGAIIDGDTRTYSRDGSGNAKLSVSCGGSTGIISVNFQKQTEYGYLIVVMIQNGKLLKSASTSAQYGIAGFAEQCLSTFGGGCLIATAAYGSELAPEVQQLRETRDNVLLHTQSGTSFMTAFNQFYYTFSPTVADWERENPFFKEAVKITITPLITTLSILNYVPVHSEAEMLSYGIGVILLNIGMYFVAPAFVIMKIRRISS